MAGLEWPVTKENDIGRGPNWFPTDFTSAAYRYYTFLEHKQGLNAHKLRIRYVPFTPGEDTKNVVFHLINSRMYTSIDYHDITSCERQIGWDGLDNPKDIVVTFRNSDLRNVVYQRRRFIQQCGENDIEILDELILERVWIWRSATSALGLFRVDTAWGCVRINSCDGKSYLVRTMDQLNQFLKTEYEILYSQFR